MSDVLTHAEAQEAVAAAEAECERTYAAYQAAMKRAVVHSQQVLDAARAGDGSFPTVLDEARAIHAELDAALRADRAAIKARSAAWDAEDEAYRRECGL